MAGDWIKMRTDLMTSPKVVRLSSALKSDRFRIVGGLHSAWCLFDAHSEDGYLAGYRPEVLDDLIGWPGFSEALIAVQWLEDDGENLILPRFDTHNGKSAKRRCMDKDRKKEGRLSASDADNVPQNVCPREEKRREDKDQKPSSSAKPTTTHAERLAQVTKDATETFNESKLVKPNGGLLATVTKVGNETRQKQVRKCITVARQICAEDYGAERITREFWADYWAECHADDHKSGRSGGGREHPNWVPTFEYLTREKTMVEVYERAGR